MCTRFFIEPKSEELDEYMQAALSSKLADRFLIAGSPVRVSGEIRPTDVVPVMAPDRSGKLSVFPMRWGFRVPGRSLVINARSESASQRQMFREPWARHRCVIPASWYYEWEHLPAPGGKQRTGDRFAIQPQGSSVTWLAGLYRIEDGFPVFAVLTREPSEDLRRIHDRMPVIFPKETAVSWIDPSLDPSQLIGAALTDMSAERSPSGDITQSTLFI